LPRQGRTTELIVEELEKLKLDDDICKIKSPDYIKDVVTVRKREVDVSIRCKIGTHEFLAIIECRNRDGVEDVRWVEQVITKTKDLNANKVVMVSTSDFTKPAKDKAKHNGIILRTLSEFKSEDAIDWPIPIFEVEREDYGITGCTFITKDDLSEKTLDDIIEKMKSDEKMFKEISTGTSIRFIQIIREVNKAKHEYLFGDVKANEPPKKKLIKIDLSNNEFLIDINNKEYYLSGLELEFECWKTLETIPFDKIIKYEENDSTLLSKVDYTLKLHNDEEVIVSISRDEKGWLKLTEKKVNKD